MSQVLTGLTGAKISHYLKELDRTDLVDARIDRLWTGLKWQARYMNATCEEFRSIRKLHSEHLITTYTRHRRLLGRAIARDTLKSYLFGYTAKRLRLAVLHTPIWSNDERIKWLGSFINAYLLYHTIIQEYSEC